MFSEGNTLDIHLSGLWLAFGVISETDTILRARDSNAWWGATNLARLDPGTIRRQRIRFPNNGSRNVFRKLGGVCKT